jgi:hypothetical protein
MSASFAEVGTLQSPTAARLLADLSDGDLLAGADAGRWHIVGIDEQFLYVEVQVGDSTDFIGLRIDYVDYPTTAPAGVIWDIEAGELLPPERWPVGAAAESVFRKDWSVSNGGALYAPWDRIAIPGHPDWAAAHPGKIWTPARTIAHYLRETRRVLEDASMPITGVVA